MRRVALALVLALIAPAAACAGGRPNPAPKTLPRNAHVIARAPIPGLHQTSAVAYRTANPYLGVMVAQRLIWKIKVPAQPQKLTVPGPSRLFSAWVPHGGGATFYAFRVGASKVTSGITGNQSGMASAGEGGSFSKASVTVMNPDTSHQGSVRYRLLDRYMLCGQHYCLGTQTRAPDYPPGQYPTPNGVIHTKHGDTLLLRLEIAATEPERELGLMYRKSLDPDIGMVFVWTAPTNESFWMQNTYIPLTVAFVGADGTILETQDMAPQTTDLHTPHETYSYAIEVNQGYFAKYGVQVGDKVAFDLHSS